MKYLRSKTLLLLLVLFTIKLYSRNDNKVSDLNEFRGIWKFHPSPVSNDTSFFEYKIFEKNKMLRLTFWKSSKILSVRGPRIVGFIDGDAEIHRLSDLKENGNRMFFYESNISAPNDSIKYYQEASPSCFTSFNGIGTDDHYHKEGTPNYLLFNFNGRDYECHIQLTHLPNFIVKSLIKQNTADWEKVRQLLPFDYKIIKSEKAQIYSSPSVSGKMYLTKGDVVEIREEKSDWLRINYYPEKDGKETGKTIEGWIKKEDVE